MTEKIKPNEAAKAGCAAATGSAVQCEWRTDGNEPYNTQCGHAFECTYDGVKENEFKYCPFCGGRIVEIRLCSSCRDIALDGYDLCSRCQHEWETTEEPNDKLRDGGAKTL